MTCRVLSIALRGLALLLGLAGISACAPSESYYLKPQICTHWSIGVVAPNHMEAWVEALYVKDNHGDWVQIPQGVVGELNQTAGWDPNGAIGGGDFIPNTQMPMEIYVRWQSLAEPQTYYWYYSVPESLRQALVTKEWGRPPYGGAAEKGCRDGIGIGVAPGGRTIVWNGGWDFPITVVAHGQATVEPLGPWLGKGKQYAYPLSDEAKQYVKEHGIPYGSW